MELSIPQLNCLIKTDSRESLEDGALQIVGNIRPEWPRAGLQCKIFTDGITNRLVGVYQEKNKDDMILIRVYGENTDLFIDRQLECRNMRSMHKAGLSAPIYCTFLNGISYGYTPGKVLDEQLVRDPNVSALIAENMARMHTLKPLVTADQKTHASLFAGLKKFLVLIESASPVKMTCDRWKKVGDLISLQSEAEFLEKELPQLGSPIVFSHNDLLLKNIILDKNNDKVTFIDFEYSDYNYQAFDIANHFCEFCGVDNFEPRLYPDKQFQLTWLRTYLRKWHLLTDTNVQNGHDMDAQVETLYDTVNKFSLAAHFYWGLWALVQATNSSINFNYLGFAIKRLDEYKKRKNELFVMSPSNNGLH